MKNIITIVTLMLIVSCSQDNESMNNLIESENFLKSNLTNQGVIEIEPGLQYLVLESSESGIQPNLDNTVTADFHGTLIDGTVFWSSIDLGEPLTIVLSQLIPGCQKAMSRMKEGDSWRLFIHPDLAYGEAGAGGVIPPNATLIFEVELL